MRFRFLIIFLPLVLIYSACTSDELPEPVVAECNGDTPTYNNQIRPIIQASCAYSGCHLDAAPGNFSSYAGLLPSLEGGIFKQRVVNLRGDENIGMPPNYAPASRPRDLTADELQVIECWLDAGFPE